MCAEVSKLHSMCPDEDFREVFFASSKLFFLFWDSENFLSEFGSKFLAELSKLHGPREEFEKNTFLRVFSLILFYAFEQKQFRISEENFFHAVQIEFYFSTRTIWGKIPENFSYVVFRIVRGKISNFWIKTRSKSVLSALYMSRGLIRGETKCFWKGFFPSFPDNKRNYIRHPAKN